MPTSSAPRWSPSSTTPTAANAWATPPRSWANPTPRRRWRRWSASWRQRRIAVDRSPPRQGSKMSPLSPTVELRTLGDLLSRIGGVAPDRIRIRPPPGTATEEDWLAADQNRGPACELVDGVLVEKPVCLKESILAAYLIAVLNTFVRDRQLGFISGESGAMALFPGLVRIPDVAFISTDRARKARVASSPIPRLAPELAIEVLSPSNTPAEMSRKREDYFAAGTKLVWQI